MDLAEKYDKKNPIVTVTELSHSSLSLDPEDLSGFSTPKPEVINDDNSNTDYPDGGSAAWLQVLAGHFTNAIACGYGATFGVFQLYYTTTLGLPASQVSWIGSFQVFILNLTCIVSGRLADAGYGRAVTLAGSILMLLGTFATSLAATYWQIFLAQGVCTGLGLGLLWMPSMTVVNSYFKRRRSLALNLASAGTGTGSLVFPATVQYLIPRIGFAWAVRCSGAVALVFVVLINALLRPRPLPKTTRKAPLVEVGALRERPYALFTAGTFLVYLALYVGSFYINSFALTLPGGAFTSTSTVNLLLLTNAVSTPARVLIGYAGDALVGPLNAYLFSVLSLALVLFSWAAVQSAVAMYVWAAAFGVANGAVQGAFLGALASLVFDPRQMGSRFGLVCGFLAFATLAGPPIAGAILDSSAGNYLGAQIWSGAVEILAVVVLLVCKFSVGSGLWALV
ncbi:hypothetical protein JX265_011879 [Neoarthrinium moseri]|uniref:Major facilitator superfamily (MFS) profile domain-containing protein n=1 Tax=Neoarthrinium moseri TaxID=1658444 RepID=A0A9P9WBX4_9PEZI|nr:hypothetical protein JX265_011879 [Neoarthrinium moseri]